MTILINLVGEQPLPNLLPVKLEQPDTVVLVHSTFTEKVARRLEKLISNKVITHSVDAYSISETAAYLRRLIGENGWKAEDIVINLTGGTKPMSLGAFHIAVESQTRAIYFRTEPPATLYLYNFSLGLEPVQSTELQDLSPILDDLHTFLRAFRDSDPYVKNDFCDTNPGRSFEKAIYEVMQGAVDQVMIGVKLDDVVDIDFVTRSGNEVALLECKLGKHRLKDGIDQLNTAGGRDYLGTYTHKVFVSNVPWNKKTNLNALAAARNIKVIELTDYVEGDEHLSPGNAALLVKKLENLLGKKHSY